MARAAAIAFAALVLAGSSRAAPAVICLGWDATVVGTEGDDVIRVGSGGDIVAALGGNDTIIGSDAESSTVCGGDGNDSIVVGGAAMAASGDAGDDRIDGSAAGAGLLVTYINAPGPIRADLAAGLVAGWGTDTVSGVTELLATRFGDTVVGGAEIDHVQGGPGDDVISLGDGDDEVEGQQGNDRISTGPGNDALAGEQGNDVLNGGPGLDRVEFLDSPHKVAIDLAAGKARGQGADRLTGIEEAWGSTFGDTITGSPRADAIHGGDGADVVAAGAGNDRVFGDRKDDRLKGGPGNDVLDGGAGRDRGDGGPGRDACVRIETRVSCP